MNPYAHARKTVLCLVAILPLAFAETIAGSLRSPQPGEVYREFTTFPMYDNDWRVTDPDARSAGTPGNSPCDFLQCDSCSTGAAIADPTCENARIPIQVGDLTGAVRAEALIDLWGGHVGTTNKRFRLNDSPWLVIPEIDSTPTDGQCYTQQVNPVIDVPLNHLRSGANILQGTSGGQTCYGFNWGQWGWYTFKLRVYYGAGTNHATGRILSPADGGIIGDDPAVEVRADSGAGIDRVELFAFHDNYDTDGDGEYLQYHESYHRERFEPDGDASQHVGTATEPIPGRPGVYRIVWDTTWVPDQPVNGIKLIARILDGNGVWTVTDEVVGLTLQREGSVRLFKPADVPEKYWVRIGRTRSNTVTIPTLAGALEARLLVRTWNGIDGSANPAHPHTKVNEWIPPQYGASHSYSYDEIDVPVSALQLGVNTISFHSRSSHHGIEILWPGAAIKVRYSGSSTAYCGDGNIDPGEECDDGNGTAGDGCEPDCSVTVSICGDGNVEPDEECDDGNTVGGDGCEADCTLPVSATTLPASYGFEGSGAAVIDDSGNGNTGTLVVPAERDAQGRFGGAVRFDGTAGHVDLGGIDVGGEQMTIALWFRADDFGVSDGRLISKATSVVEQDHFWMISTFGSALRFRLKTTGNDTATLISNGPPLSAGVWTHAAATYDGSSMKIYQDGQLVGSAPKSGSIAIAPSVVAWIGDNPGGARAFDGTIDEVRILDQALTAAEIQAVMDAPIGSVPACGDGNFDAGEECDDGPANSDTEPDACRGDCTLPRCGDGVPDAGEACDDGNPLGGDGCDADCALEYCGDGVVQPGLGEQCDDGNLLDGDGCQSGCSWPVCGDGIVDGEPTGEYLAGGGFENWGPLTPDGWSAWIGGGDLSRDTVNPHGGEAAALLERTGTGSLGLSQIFSGLDPGREYEISGWSRVDDGGPVAGFPSVRLRNLQAGEYVDATGAWGPTANAVIGGVAPDGSWTPFSFRFETATGHSGTDRYQLLLIHQARSPVGSRVYIDDVSLGGPLDVETCDDGNLLDGDGCDASCAIEYCGDGVVQPGLGEQCDDGNLFDGDGCQSGCSWPVCGDGIVDGDSAREHLGGGGFEDWGPLTPDGWSAWISGGDLARDTVNPHGGEAAALLERTGTGSLGLSQIFNGLDPGREYEISGWSRVDDGGPVAGFPSVRLRNLQAGEYVDATGAWGPTANAVIGGVAPDGSWTPFSFRFETATGHSGTDRYQLLLIHQALSPVGSRVYIDDVSLGGPLDVEACDDGNLLDGDGCDASCALEYCGDGVVQPALGEECDDGNPEEDDGCRTTCRLPACGDGIVDAGPVAEFLVDGGFENWSDDFPDGWFAWLYGGELTRETAVPHGGQASAALERTTSGALAMARDIYGLLPGSEYELTGWSRVDPGGPVSGFPSVRLRNVRTGQYVGTSGAWGPTANALIGGAAQDGSWTPFSIRFATAPDHRLSDRYQLLLLHQARSPIGSKVYHDDVSLVGPDGGEECDDGNAVGDDACDNACRFN